MSSRITTVLGAIAGTVLLSSTTFAQDSPSPAVFRGVWEGNVNSAFAAANPSIPDSYECMPNGATIQAKHKVTIGEFNVTYGPWSKVTLSQGAATWTFPAFAGKTFLWSAYSDNIMKLRTSPTTLECYWGRVEGKGSDRKLTIVTLGGAGFSWQDQCSAAAYQAIKDVEKTPYCESLPGSRAPYKSTILGQYTYKGGDVQGSGASSLTLSALSGIILVAFGIQGLRAAAL